jgi:hypothetical protein
MRYIVLVGVLVSALGVVGQGQTTPVSLRIEADTISRLIPVEDIGVIKPGPANLPLTATGNVVIQVNDLRITADMAVWRSGSNEIELNGGSARVQLPSAPTSLGIKNR